MSQYLLAASLAATVLRRPHLLSIVHRQFLHSRGCLRLRGRTSGVLETSLMSHGAQVKTPRAVCPLTRSLFFVRRSYCPFLPSMMRWWHDRSRSRAMRLVFQLALPWFMAPRIISWSIPSTVQVFARQLHHKSLPLMLVQGAHRWWLRSWTKAECRQVQFPIEVCMCCGRGI